VSLNGGYDEKPVQIGVGKLGAQPVLTLFLILGMGYLIGNIR
jgi:hypothetical protein